MRTKTIILGAIAALALATLTANAGNRATHQVVQQGSLVSLVAAATTVTKTDRDVASAGKTATGEDGTEAVQKPVVAAKPAPKITVSTDCQNAINNLKALRQADATEDAAERAAAQQPPSGTDKVEDASDRQQWRAALLAARSACVPQPSPACQAAIAALQSLKGNGDEPELTDLRNINWTAELASLRTAIGVVATACGERD